MITIELAGLPIGIENHYPFVARMCRDYITEKKPLFTVSACEEDIDNECEQVRL